jgi:cytochrome c553
MTDKKRSQRVASAAVQVALIAFVASTAKAQTPNAADVRLWAASCAACHGTNGKASGAGLHIAGKPVKDLYNDLMGYKAGTKTATVMHQHAKGYSDNELRLLAEHFSNIK